MNLMETNPVLLVADDDPDDRLLIREAMSECKSRADLRCVENGEDLLDYLLRRNRYASAEAPSPALILLDLNMPRKDGREALREIKSHPALKRIPVVILTTSKADTDIAGLYDLGANSFISKPVHFDELVNVVRLLGEYWFRAVQLPAMK